MDIVNETPFAVATMLWEDLQGQSKLSVLTKGTFEIQTNAVALPAPAQLPIFTADEYYGENPTASVRFESDMVPFKPRADVVLIGRAQAANGRPVTRLDVTLRVGRLEKKIRVFGDRQWWFPTRLVYVPVISPPAYF